MISKSSPTPDETEYTGPGVPVLIENGHTFRDLNKNGKLDLYEDIRLPIDTRVEDLLSQMTVEEKAGLMFHPMIGTGPHSGDLWQGSYYRGYLPGSAGRDPRNRSAICQPAICHATSVALQLAGLFANFGANDGALLDVIFGEFNPTGRLPFELPSSMEAVREQDEDVPYDSVDPLFPFGFGQSYS